MTNKPVPHELIPSHNLPAPTYRDLPDAPSWVRLIGPSILLLGLSIGSGEFILWPHITYRFGFVVFWACMLGLTASALLYGGGTDVLQSLQAGTITAALPFTFILLACCFSLYLGLRDELRAMKAFEAENSDTE